MLDTTLLLTLILFSILFFKITKALDREHQKYKKYMSEYIESLEEGIAIRDEAINTVLDYSRYYKKAYEDTINKHIEILKRINKKTK